MSTPLPPSGPDGRSRLPYPDAATLADHWWWRPGWQVGTRFYAWHVAVADLPPLAEHVAAYQTALRQFGFLDPVPRPWLHISVQGLDHTHAVTDAQLDQTAAAVRARLAAIPALTLTFDRPVLHREAVVIPPTDRQPLRTVRDAVRAGIAAAFGPPEGAPPDRYRPHTSVAYVNAHADPHPVRAALDALDVPPTPVTISHLTLMEIHRDRRMYEWRALEEVPLGLSARDHV